MRSRAPWPQMVVATAMATVLPAALVWGLSAAGVIGSVWTAIALSAVLALGLSSLGSAYWRRHATGDVLFSDLLLWGWLRRGRMQRRLGRADDLLRQAGSADAEQKAAVLSELGAALDAEDPYLDGHSRRVARYATMIAGRMQLPDAQVARLKAAAAVHDIGKLRTPGAVLHKAGRLTDAEFAVMKRHAAEGGAMVESLDDPVLAAAVRGHHERWDGSGYPDGLAGEAIPLEARIISVADTFDAITSARSYRPATPHARALEVIDEEAGRQLDPDAARAFISCYSDRRGAALWAGLAALPRQLAERFSLTPADLAVGALAAPLVVVAGAAAAAAMPATQAPPRDVPAAAKVAQAPPPATPTPTPARTPTPGSPEPSAPVPTVAAPPAGPTSTPVPAQAAAAPAPAPEATPTPTPLPLLEPLPIPPPFPTVSPTPTPTPPVPTPTSTPTPTPTEAPSPEPTATPHPPHTVEDCKDDGWVILGYPNQGQCVAEASDPG